MIDFDKKALEEHRRLGGKLRIEPADTLDTKEKLSTYYTPGVGAVCREIAEHPESARELTGIGRTVAVISDGSAILGLGNLGPIASLPVMEGKCMLFKEFGGVDAVPVVINSHTADEIVKTIEAIAPSYGGINLEDIAAPTCFEVEQRLKSSLSIPVFHDDQHGTAIVVLAGLINATKVVNKELKALKVVIIGAGAAGHAVAELLVHAGIEQLIVTDRQGIIVNGREGGLRQDKQRLADITNPNKLNGDLESAIVGADVLVGVSGPNIVTPAMVSSMANQAIVFGLSNPIPEIMPEEAIAAGAAIVATGRSDLPNQVNNALVFPGVFAGALKHHVTNITDDHKLAAAQALASLVEQPAAEHIIPSITDKRILETVSSAIV